jgi:hypothetical protein
VDVNASKNVDADVSKNVPKKPIGNDFAMPNDDHQPEMDDTPSNQQKDVADVSNDDPRKSNGNRSAVPNSDRQPGLGVTPSNQQNKAHSTAIPEPQRLPSKDSGTRVVYSSLSLPTSVL